MRTYQALWERLKTGEPVIVECPLELRRRIKKALNKERGFDRAFAARHPQASMYFTQHPSGWHIQVYLTVRTGAL